MTEFSGLPQLVKRTEIRTQVLRSCPHSQLRGREVEAEIHPFHKEGNWNSDRWRETGIQTDEVTHLPGHQQAS